MPFFKADDLQAWTGGKWSKLDPSRKPEIRGFSNDSRNIGKDFAFVAIKAERDGHDFAAAAAANGATAIIAERELDVEIPTLVVKDSLKAFQRIAKMHRLRFEHPVVGITGSCGKTSTKEMLAKLTAWKNPLITEKNFNNEIGVPLTLTRIDLRQNQLAIVEAGVGAPDQMRELATMIEPDIAIITNVGLSHLERFEQVGNVAKEKAVLPAHAADGGWCLMHHNLLGWKAFDELKCKKAIVAPADAPEFKADLVFRYAVSDIENDFAAIDMCIEGGDEYYFEVPQMTKGMLENALLAIAATLMLGGREEQMAQTLEGFAPLPMRGGIVETDAAKYYLDCYNASPTSMKDALARFAKISESAEKRAYVLGTMAELGLASHPHHKDIGAHIQPYSNDVAVLVGAFADVYKTGLLENGWDEKNIFVFDTAEAAKAKVAELGGFVFVKGSRVCALEKALPDAVLEKLSAAPAKRDEPEEEPEEETPAAPANEVGESDGGEDIEDEDENSDEFEDADDGVDDGGEDSEDFEEEDDEDERERI